MSKLTPTQVQSLFYGAGGTRTFDFQPNTISAYLISEAGFKNFQHAITNHVDKTNTTFCDLPRSIRVGIGFVYGSNDCIKTVQKLIHIKEAATEVMQYLRHDRLCEISRDAPCSCGFTRLRELLNGVNHE